MMAKMNKHGQGWTAVLLGAAAFCAPGYLRAATGPNIAVSPGVMTTAVGTTASGGGGAYGNGGLATSPTIYNPAAVRFDGAGNLYVLDAGNMVVRKVIGPGLTGAGNIVAFAGTGVSGGTGDGGNATAASFSATARGLYVNAAGVVWISDSGNNVVRKIDTTGKITTVAGTNALIGGYTGDGGAATSATLNNPGGIYVDAAGNLYIADTGNNVVRLVNTSGVISTFAGGSATVCKTTADALGDGCPIAQSILLAPSDVYGDAAGNLDILDAGDFRVRKANATTGLITSIVGTGVKGTTDNTSAVAGALGAGASGITIDSTGNLFIADTGNNKIRMVTVAGAISTVAGNGTAGSAGDGNSAIAAYLNAPLGVTVDASNNVYIADTQSSRIREVLVNSGVVTLATAVLNVLTTGGTPLPLIVNTGTAPLTFTGITVTAPFAQKAGVSTDCKVGTPVAVGGTCTLTFTYTPTATGVVNASATLLTNAANAPQGTTTIQLYGLGVAAGASATTTTLTTSYANVLTQTVGQSVTLTATVAGAVGTTVAPTGSVQFTSGLTVLGVVALTPSATVVNSSIATFTTTALTLGIDAVVATYLGDATYKTSLSAAQIIGVYTGAMDFGFTTSTTALTVANGSSGTVTLNVYSLGGYANTVGFQCPNLPSGATCNFVPFTTFIGAGRQSTPNITVTLAFPLPLSSKQDNGPWRPAGGIAFALLLGGGLALRRRGRSLVPALLVLFLGLVGVTSLSGCSSASSQQSLVGMYNIQIVASDGVISHTVTVPVTVQ